MEDTPLTLLLPSHVMVDTPDLDPAQVPATVQEHGVQTLQSATKRVNN